MRFLVKFPAALLAVALSCGLLLPVGLAVADEAEIRRAVMERLGSDDRELLQKHLEARRQHENRLNNYWATIEAKKRQRSIKRKARQLFTLDDYVLTFPPQYKGPALSARIAKLFEEERRRREPPGDKPEPKSAIPGVADMLAAAKRYYGFVPERIAESEFKLRYARESVRLGLTKDQVVRVYALETGGRGTFDMQAGIHPIKRTGQPISTALGYAQLLNANSISELVAHGGEFVARLERLAQDPQASQSRRKRLRDKIRAVNAMRRVAKSVKNDWYVHMRLARTGKGMGIHTLNLDGDIGPLLQVIKLQGLRDLAATWGMKNLTGAELELMNLAGPRTGLEMMQPLTWDAPTSNFFARRGYYRNSVVRGRTARELMLELDKRIDAAMKHDGAREFMKAFDQVQRRADAR
ncbi:MAG: hypothetical protein RLZ98_381 [Pseudomonadota bacterium]